MKRLMVGLLLLLISQLLHSQSITDSILVATHYRSFSYYKPANVKGGSLLFVMHGSGGNSADMIGHTTKLEAIASREKLLLVYPNGYQHFWNECRLHSTALANKENIDEQVFFNGMIQYFNKKFSINVQKVFAAGFSGGGQMAYKLGLTMPDRIKGIAAIVANMPDSASCDCTLAGKAMPVIIINGTADNVNPYNGGEMFVSSASFGVVLSAENTFAYWSALAGYTGAPVKTLLPDTDPTDGKTIESFSYRQRNKPPVTLLKVVGGKHDYPGDIDVFLYVWNFFKGVK